VFVDADKEAAEGLMLGAYAGISAVRVACIAAGDPPAPALPRPHLGEIPALHTCYPFYDFSDLPSARLKKIMIGRVPTQRTTLRSGVYCKGHPTNCFAGRLGLFSFFYFEGLLLARFILVASFSFLGAPELQFGFVYVPSPWLVINIPDHLFPSYPRAATYYTVSDSYATAAFARCCSISDTSTNVAIANAVTAYNACQLGRTSCAAQQTATMLTAYARIAATREACIAWPYPSTPLSSRPEPPKIRFENAAVLVNEAAVDVFDAATFMRCNEAALDSSVAAHTGTDRSGDLAAYTGICAVRTACILAGHPPAPALPRAHPGASPLTCLNHQLSVSTGRLVAHLPYIVILPYSRGGSSMPV